MIRQNDGFDDVAVSKEEFRLCGVSGANRFAIVHTCVEICWVNGAEGRPLK